MDTDNTINYFNGANSSSDSKFDLNQTGAAFVFNNTNINSPWRKFTLGVAYDKISNFENAWNVRGVNTNAQSIGDYFLGYAQGLRLDQISAFEDESLSSAYADINSTYGFGNQQGFLGFESYIVEPNSNDDANTLYYSNIVGNNFDQEYTYASTGYNGKFSFNASTQYGDNFYFGLSLNSHFINYEKFTDLYETNTNAVLYQRVLGQFLIQ